jgi:flagellar hook-associated protein 1 FlgK
MSLDLALHSALTGISVSQVQLDVATSNITNANTAGYTRKQANLSSVTAGGKFGIGSGVTVESITRSVNDSLALEIRKQTSKLAEYSAKQDYAQRTESIFGSVASQTSLTANITDLINRFSSVATDPNNPISQVELINLARDLANQINTASTRIQDLRKDVDTEVSNSIKAVNTALNNINDLNGKISKNVVMNVGTGDLEDQRDLEVSKVAEQMDIRVFTRGNKETVIYTNDGTKLLDNTAQTLQYTPVSSIDPTVTQADSGFDNIDFANSSLATDLTKSFRTGRLKGLLDMRDTVLPNMASQLENISSTLQNIVNGISNQGTAYPPPQSLTGTRILNATDPFYATGQMRIAITDSAGNFSDYVDLDLSTITSPAPKTINDFISAVNASTTAIGGVAFNTIANVSLDANGKMNFAALGAKKIAIGLAAGQTVPATEQVTGKNFNVSQFFGLNDVFVSSLSESNPVKLVSNNTFTLTSPISGTGKVRLGVTDAAGVVQSSFDLNLAALPVATVGDVINEINGAAIGITASLGSDGKLYLKANSANQGVEVNLLSPAATDTASAENFVQFFDLRDPRHTATSIQVNQALVNAPQLLTRGKLNNQVITLPIPVNAPIAAITAGDGTIANAITNAFDANSTFLPTGDISGVQTSLTSYASLYLGNNARINSQYTDNYDNQKSLTGQLQLQNSATSGVDMDSELASLTQIQNAYSASSRVIKVVSDMFQELSNLVGN